MSSVDSRIVTMKFDNTQFQSGATQTMSTFSKLKSMLSGMGSMGSTASKGFGLISGALSKFGIKNPFASSTQGLADLQGGVNKFNTGNIEGGITHISKAWVAMATVAVTAISRVTSTVLQSGAQWAKGFTIGPILDGLHEYQTNLQAIQTVQANTDQPLSKINASLAQLNHYSDLTIYNFGEMAKNVGTFTAAGVDLQTSVSSIKGIANMAALSGSNSQQAATAMYQLSQAIASGKVGLMDWNSVVNAGMGGKKLQNALAQTAIAMGQLNAQQVKGVKSGEQLKIAGQSFRNSISATAGGTKQAWLSSKVLVNTLATLDGRFSVSAYRAQLTTNGLHKYTKAQAEAKVADNRAALEKKEGVKYTDAQFKALTKLSDSAFESATKVKTLGQVFDVAKESIGSGWSASFANIFGNLHEAQKTFTGMSNGLGLIIKRNALARNKVLASWKSLGGRDTLIEGLKNAWTAFYKIIQTVGGAFRDVFPRKTGQDLADMTKHFEEFTKSLIPGKATLDGLSRTARGVFAVFDIGWQIIKGFLGVIGDMFSAFGDGSGSILNFTGSIGDFLFSLDQAIKKGGLLKGFFSTLGSIMQIPIHVISVLAGALSGLFGGFDTGKAKGATDAVGRFAVTLSPLDKLMIGVQNVLHGLAKGFEHLLGVTVPVGNTIGKILGSLGDAIASAFSGDNFNKTLDLLNTGLFAGLILLFKKFTKNPIVLNMFSGNSLFPKMDGVFGQLTDTLKAFQSQIQANTLLKIAAAIGILALALVILAGIDSKKLTKALVAMAATFAELLSAMYIMQKVSGTMGAIKMPLLAAGLILLAGALVIMALAIKIMSTMSWDELLRGLTGLGVTLALLAGAVALMGGAKRMLAIGAGLLLISAGVAIMSGAIKVLGGMSWGDLIKGLFGIAAVMAILAASIDSLGGPLLPLTGAGLVLIATGISIMSGALAVMGGMSWSEMIKSLVELAGALAILTVAVDAMGGPLLPLTGAGLVLVATGLTIMAGALKIMGSMSWSEIAKSLVELAGAFVILAAGTAALTGGIVGAAALLVIAGALAILVPELVILGAMSWGAILKSLAALAGVFVILGVAGMLLAPVTPVLIGLGAAVLLFGAGVALAGVGVLALTTALSMLVAMGGVAAGVMGHFIGAIIKKIPGAMKAVGHGIVLMAKEVAKGGQQFFQAFVTILSSMLRAIHKNLPKIAKTFVQITDTGLRVIRHESPNFVRTGFQVFMDFLHGLSKNMPKIVNTASSIVVKFLNGIGRNSGRINNAGINMIVKFVNGMANAINKHSSELNQAGFRLAGAIINGMTGGLLGKIGGLAQTAAHVAKSALDAAKHALGIGSPSKEFHKVGQFAMMGFAMGMDKHSAYVERAADNSGKRALKALKASMARMTDHVVDELKDPVISPVLDLTKIQQGAKDLDKMISNSHNINPHLAVAASRDISRVQQAVAAAQAARSADQAPVTEMKFEQNNYSPQTLSPVKIYRNTKSLLAMAREAQKV